MDYKELYEQALERAKKFQDKELFAECNGNLVEYIFPELKESEDERIRKEIIAFLTYFHTGQGNSVKYDDGWIDWLEKQGQKPQGKSALEAAKEEKVDNQNCVKTDNVEPKFNFKVGQWIVATGKCVYLITKIDGFNVTLVDTNGDEYVFDVSSLDDAYQWTIEDAKDGDVLVCPKYAGDIIPNIFIFKDIKIKDNDVFCYCSFLETFRTEGYIANADPINTDFYPATKEQRDLLFQKMKDEGYEFDFEKKELKKIEQKPAWSEEDEVKINRIVGCLENLNVADNDILLKDVDWLKSLRPQNRWKPSDEQMVALKHAFNDGSIDFDDMKILGTLYEQLKALHRYEQDT